MGPPHAAIPINHHHTVQRIRSKTVKRIQESPYWECDTLLPLAQPRTELDLDDGVKVSCLKLGEALAPITGLAAKEEE